ncbi:MAG: hypothetical protein ACPGU4_06825 [Flavobacteriales bacterium]
MTRIVKLSSNDPKQVELLLKVAKEMGITVSFEDEAATNSVQEPALTYEQKKILDDRRATMRKEDFVHWEAAKAQLKTKKK